MVRGMAASPRLGWNLHDGGSPVETMIGRRRWRILVNVQPLFEPSEPVPPWIRTPEQFVDWLALRLRPAELRTYFRELESIAREIYDLELLRFARRYLGRAPQFRRG
jgi:hypothetical protein